MGELQAAAACHSPALATEAGRPAPCPARHRTGPHLLTTSHCPCCSFLPRNVAIIGYARTSLTHEKLRDKLRPGLKVGEADADAFLERCTYVAGAPLNDG